MRLRTDLPGSIKSAGMTLIDPAGETFAYNVGEKRDLLAGLNDDQQLVLVWTGGYHSDAFAITAGQARDLMDPKAGRG